MPTRILGNWSTTATVWDGSTTDATGVPLRSGPVGSGDGFSAPGAAPVAGLTPAPLGLEAPDEGPLPFEELAVKLNGPKFIDRVREVAKHNGFKPEWLMSVMFNESGFKPKAKNRQTGAVGLIQFMPPTAKWLGTSTAALSKMSGVQQLKWVDEYFSRFPKGAFKNGADLYLANFYPVAIGREPGFVLGSEVSDARARRVGEQNPGFDVDHDGYISVQDFRNFYSEKFPQLDTA